MRTISTSPEPPTGFGEGVFVRDDTILDSIVRGEVIVFGLKLAIEPACEIAQRLGHDLLGILGGRLPGRTVARHVNDHAVFVIVAASVGRLSRELVEVPPLHGLEAVGDAVESGILQGIVTDALCRTLGVAEVALVALCGALHKACFEGYLSHAKGATGRIREYAPQDTTLHSIADRLEAIQWRNFYQLSAEASHRGRYYHEHAMSVDVTRDSATWQPPTTDAEEIVTDALRDLARWLYRQLQAEYDHLTSDEAIEEGIIVNEYTFTEAGRRFG